MLKQKRLQHKLLEQHTRLSKISLYVKALIEPSSLTINDSLITTVSIQVSPAQFPACSSFKLELHLVRRYYKCMRVPGSVYKCPPCLYELPSFCRRAVSVVSLPPAVHRFLLHLRTAGGSTHVVWGKSDKGIPDSQMHSSFSLNHSLRYYLTFYSVLICYVI